MPVTGWRCYLLFPGVGLMSPVWSPIPTNSANTQMATKKLWEANPKVTPKRIAPLKNAAFSF